MALPLSYNFRNLLVRRVSTLAAAGGIALVVLVFIMVLALADGFAHAVRTTGSPANAMALRKGATAEITSLILREVSNEIEVLPEIHKDPSGAPLVVSELVTLVVLPRGPDGAPANVTIRGTSARALGLRPAVRVAEGGRFFQKGLPEVVVGRSLSTRMGNLGLGATARFARQDWKVVGIFETGGTGFESEVWGDGDLLQQTFRREGIVQSVTFRMADPAGFEALKARVESDPRYQVDLKTEAQYYSEQAGMLLALIEILGYLVTITMSIGAVFGAMNTMYAAVGSRAREIATLRALGFGRGAILLSFIAESLALSALGGAAGLLLSLPIHGITTGTTNWDTFSELSFAFRITPAILAQGFAFALVMGAAGGLLPALRAARLPITLGLREN